MNASRTQLPPGKIKIMQALSTLLKEKDFHSITTALIAKEAGVTEGLIYKYFKDKKALLYGVLEDHFSFFYEHVKRKLTPESTALEKLDVIIKITLKAYARNRVLSRIILLEVRNSPEFFDHPAYDMVKLYARSLIEIIKQGQEQGEIRREVNPTALFKVIAGAIEHGCLTEIIFNRELDSDSVAEQINDILFSGVKSK